MKPSLSVEASQIPSLRYPPLWCNLLFLDAAKYILRREQAGLNAPLIPRVDP